MFGCDVKKTKAWSCYRSAVVMRKYSSSKVDEYALVKALKAASFQSRKNGVQVHPVVIKLGLCWNTILMTALMDFKIKRGCLDGARKLLDEMPQRDVVSWTFMIVGCAKYGLYKESFQLLRLMIANDTIPNEYSYSGALMACYGLQSWRPGQQIHAHVLVSGILTSTLVLRNDLLNMYSRCHRVSCARNLFDSMTTRDNIAWNEMISGYLIMGQAEEALKVFASMVSQGVKPDDYSYAICTDACADLAMRNQGSQIHACIIKSGFHSDEVVANALVDMYAKCGCLGSAKLVFHSTPAKDARLWTSMISALGKHGQVQQVLLMFEQMREANVKPDGITYLAVLSACSRGGHFAEGWFYFRVMTEKDLIAAGPEQYACMVDLLCRGGHLQQALQLIEQMPLPPSISVWSTFLSSCRLQQNTGLADLAADQLRQLDPRSPSDILVLSSTEAGIHDWKITEKLRQTMEVIKVKKEPGCSWVELRTGVHVFLIADRSHPQMNQILSTLKNLTSSCKEERIITWKNFSDTKGN